MRRILRHLSSIGWSQGAPVGRIAAVLLGSVVLLAPIRAQSEAPPAGTDARSAQVDWGRVLDLRRRLGDVRTESTPDGGVFVLETDKGTLRLTPEGFFSRLHEVQEAQRRNGALYRLLNITTPWGCLWVGLGLFGQVLFTFRMVLQWYASEREHRSVVPVGFWWGSLFGGLMLLVYFVWRKDLVGILGQSTGVVVYARNLILIHRTARPPLVAEARTA